MRSGGKGIFFVGGAFGKGDVYKLNGGNPEQICAVEVAQASVGWVLGGEVLSEIIFFETEQDFNRFMSVGFEGKRRFLNNRFSSYYSFLPLSYYGGAN